MGNIYEEHSCTVCASYNSQDLRVTTLLEAQIKMYNAANSSKQFQKGSLTEWKHSVSERKRAPTVSISQIYATPRSCAFEVVQSMVGMLKHVTSLKTLQKTMPD